MPTIYQLACGELVGTLALCPPCGAGDVTARRANRFLFFRIHVKLIISENQKLSVFLFPQIKGITTPVITAR